MDDLNWFIRNRSSLCPKHIAPPASLVKTTSWCPQCQKLWKLRRSQYSWRYQWWFVNGGEKYLEKEHGKKDQTKVNSEKERTKEENKSGARN